MKKLNEIAQGEKVRQDHDEKRETQDEIERVETGSSAEFMDKVNRQLKAIKHFKAAFVR